MSTRHPIVRSTSFTLLATALGLPLAGVVAWTSRGGPAMAGPLATVAYMATPLLAAMLWNRAAGQPLGHRLAFRLRPGSSWLAAVWTPLVIALAALAASLAWPGVHFDGALGGLLAQLDPATRSTVEPQLADLPPAWVLIPLMLVQGVVAGSTINALAAYGEEAGWRGWMHEELAPIGFWPRALVTGVLWGLWHAPLILQGHNYPQHPVLGVGFMVAMCVGLSGPMAEVRDRTDSAVAAAVFHGVFNAVAMLPVLFAVGGSDLEIGVTGAAGILVLLLVNLGLALLRAQNGSSNSSSDQASPMDTTATRNATSS